METDYFVFTAVGPDRVGLVDDITEYLVKKRCNILESRMASLGGEFAVIMLLQAPESSYRDISGNLGTLAETIECSVEIKKTSMDNRHQGWKPYIIHVSSVDAPGIVHALTSVLHSLGINIEDLHTDTVSAPWTGTPMFHLKARISVPAGVSPASLRNTLNALETEKDMDIDIKPFSLDSAE